MRSSEADARAEALLLLSAELAFFVGWNRWKEAVDRAEALVGLEETNFMANFVLGMHDLSQRRWESAGVHLERARANPHPEIRWPALGYQLSNAIAWARLRNGDVQGAIAPAEEALGLAPDIPAIWDTCGEAWVRSGKLEPGMALLERAWAASTRSPAADRAFTARSLALGSEHQGDVDAASRWRALARELAPDVPEALH